MIFAGSDYVTYTELENSSELTLTVHFVGEPGQVTRLFPQSILRGMGYPLDIQVILKVSDCQVSQLRCVTMVTQLYFVHESTYSASFNNSVI